MKASLKFREDQKPLFRAKVPLNIFGFPFQSGIVGGESNELTLNLGTFFESGPAIKLAYRPNDSWNPFSLVVKTGSGPFGSPMSSFMIMSAEFNLLGRGNPNFMLHLKPRFGDFSVKKSQSSVLCNGVGSDDDASVEVVDAPSVVNGGYFPEIKKITMLPRELPTASAITGLFSGMEVSAKTTVPVKSRVAVNFRWGVRVPAADSGGGNSTAGIAFQKIPFLVMNKIGLEHVDSNVSVETTNVGPGNADMADAYHSFKRHMEILQFENAVLKKAVEDLREEINGRKSRFSDENFNSGIKPATGKKDRRREEKKLSESGRNREEDVNEELKKALMGPIGT